MSNRLAKSESPVRRSPHEWAATGNAFLASISRYDVRWVVRDGRCVIEHA